MSSLYLDERLPDVSGVGEILRDERVKVLNGHCERLNAYVVENDCNLVDMTKQLLGI